jgi:hypothetical protein
MMKSIGWMLALASVSLTAGCVTTTGGDFCDVATAIRPSTADRLTDGTAEQILKLNRYGAQACGWRRIDE